MSIFIYNRLKALAKLLLPCVMLLLGTFTLHAQNTAEQYRDIYDQAEQDYNIGRLKEAEEQLLKNMKNFPIVLRQGAYRMLALCYIGMDQEDDAKTYVQMLLDENPYYSTTINDPQRFIDMVDDYKSGLVAKITTASSQAESLEEVPVPTTLITEEMIINSGATNLQELLATYVPGMTIVDCNDDINISMRGIYSNGQEKILIMLNGHRLNSYCTNIASPDFSMSLEKLKQIEVLRGPASSLYGGVALTAVVNLITKQGADIDGLKAKAGIGNYGQMRGDLLIGKRYFDLDLLIWGSLYKADGQNVFIKSKDTGLMSYEGSSKIGAIGNKPTYDAGASIKYKNLKFLYNTHFSQVQSPLTMTYTRSPYDADKYRTFNGIRPSFATNSHHVELSYEHVLKNISLNGGIAYDNSDLTHYNAISDGTVSTLAQILPIPEIVRSAIEGQDGISRYINGQEHTISGKLQGSWNYINTPTHKGQLSFGGEFIYFNLNDVRYAFGYNFNKTLPETDRIQEIGKGHESNINGFIQLKHHWRSFILNAGLRYDYKYQYDDTKLRELSPRIALIYLQPKWNVKLSYSKSFVDAPYLYRKSNDFLTLMNYGLTLSKSDLTPETLHSLQLTFAATQWLKGLNIELNGFYNKAKDLIYFDFMRHYNDGNISSYGVEMNSNYEFKRFSANMNVTWQKIKDAKIERLDANNNYNIPELSANVVLAWKVTKNLRLHAHANLYTKQIAHYIDMIKYGEYIIEEEILMEYLEDCVKKGIYPDEKTYKELANNTMEALENSWVKEDVDPRVIFNIGANYTYKNLELGFNVRNLFNTKYYQSGMSTGLILQKGRWFMFDISYKF